MTTTTTITGTNEMSVEEWRELQKAPAKYGNKKCTVGALTFDSQAEANRYAELRLMEVAGIISGLRCQPSYDLQAAFTDGTGTRHRSIRYVGDFAYMEKGCEVVEDVKGHRTEVFKLKEKLFRFRYPHINFRIIDIH